MTFSENELDRVIHLAHLTVDPKKKTAYLKQLQDILSYMDTLNQIDVSHEPASVHAAQSSTLLRDDVVQDPQDLLLERNAPKWDDNAFEVPSILGSDS